MIELNKEQRLAPSYLLYVILKSIAFFVMFIIAFNVFTDGFVRFFIGMIFVVFLVAGISAVIYEWLFSRSFSFLLGDEGLTMKSGIISKKGKMIPYSNVQSIDIGYGVLRKMMNIATVRIWTASPNQVHIKNEKRPDGWLLLKKDDAEWVSNFILSKKKKV